MSSRRAPTHPHGPGADPRAGEPSAAGGPRAPLPDGLLEAVALHTSDGVMVVEVGRDDTALTATVVFANAAFLARTGYDEADLVGRPAGVLAPISPDPSALGAFARAFATETSATVRGRFRCRDGSTYPADTTVTPIRHSSDGQATTHWVTIIRDVTAQVELERRLARQALYDPLTGTATRLLFLDRLSVALKRRRLDGGRAGVLAVDLDRFRVVNEGLGHSAGDRVLERTARRLEESVRPSDTVARLGGDGFAILVHRLDEPAAANLEHTAHRIVRRLAEPMSIDGREVHAPGSVGVAVSDLRGDETPDDLLRAAVTALNDVKRRGRLGTVGHSAKRGPATALPGAGSDEFALETDLHGALGRGELAMHFQAIYAIADRRLLGAEALMRWCHPRRGWVPPVRFIPIAEATGIIHELGRFALREACRVATTWTAAAGAPSVSVNLSARQIQRADFVDQVTEVLAETGLPASRLILEMTESVATDSEDAEAMDRVLSALADLGVRSVIDDFGTGHSSLLRFRQLPVAGLKIDQSFVRDCATDADDRAIVAAIVSLGHALGKRVTAEGVETPEVFDQLRSIGCDEAQGFGLHRPCSAAEFADLLAARAA